jgi:hypothetical protein
MSSSPFLCAASLSLDGVRVDTFKPLHGDSSEPAISPHYQPVKKSFNLDGLLRFLRLRR